MLTKPKAWSAQKCLQMAELLFFQKKDQKEVENIQTLVVNTHS